MPPSFKDRGNRLQAFARHHSDGNRGQNTNVVQFDIPSDRVEQPQPIAPAPTRQTFVDERAPVPRRNTATPRLGNGYGQPPPLPRSPNRPPGASPNGRARTGSGVPHGDIFSGSQLGESFMESGLTTPQNEPAEKIELGPELARDLMTNLPQHQIPTRGGPPQLPKHTTFVPANNGMLSVVERPPRHDPVHIGDGFRDGIINGHKRTGSYFEGQQVRPGSPLRREAKIPMREVKIIRRTHSGKSEAFGGDAYPRSSTPPAQQSRWNMQVKENSQRPMSAHENDTDSIAGSEHMTPKARKTRPATQTQTQTAIFDISTPVVPVSRHATTVQKRRRPDPEYDDMALSSMTFTELQKQPFDFDPSKEEERAVSTNADNVVSRLNQFRHLGEREQHTLFANMSIEDWEASGDWFVSEFAGLVKALTESRRNKRRMIQRFEHEAACREEAVRVKTETIDRKLSKMKQDGQRVVDDRNSRRQE